MPPKPDVNKAVEDLLGGSAPTPAKSTAKPAAPAAPRKVATATSTTKAKPTATKPAAPSVTKKAPAKPSPAKAAVAAKPAAAKAKGKAPAPKPKAAKPAAAKATRGQGAYYFDPAAREALSKKLAQQVRKPTTTAEYAARHELPTWQVRRAAVLLEQAGRMTLKKGEGASLTMTPKG